MKFACSRELPDKKYRSGLFTRTICTFRINTKKNDYIWVVGRNRFTGRLKKLWLYNVTERREEDDRLLVGDMLKLLLAYVIITNPCFPKVLHEYLEQTSKYIPCMEQRLKEQKDRLGTLKMEIPRFTYDELVDLIRILEQILAKQKEMVEFLGKYHELSVQLQKTAGEVPAKILLSFLEDFFLYWRAAKEAGEHMTKIQKQSEEYLSLIFNREMFRILYEVLDLMKGKYEEFLFYKKIPLLAEMVEKDFSEHITDRYRTLVQNKTIV